MVRKWVLIIILFSLYINLFTACTTRKENITLLDELKQALANANIQCEEIFHIDTIKDGVLVFYKKDAALHPAFIRNSSNKWEFVDGGGGSPLKPREPLGFHGSNFSEVPLWMSYGVIADVNIYKLKVGNLEEKKYAKIIMTEDGIRFWFATWNEPTHPPIKYTAFAANGEVIYNQE